MRGLRQILARSKTGEIVKYPVEGTNGAKAAGKGNLTDGILPGIQQQLGVRHPILGKQCGKWNAKHLPNPFADVKITVTQMSRHVLQSDLTVQIILNVGDDSHGQIIVCCFRLNKFIVLHEDFRHTVQQGFPSKQRPV